VTGGLSKKQAPRHGQKNAKMLRFTRNILAGYDRFRH
jgi:hypothetical protein